MGQMLQLSCSVACLDKHRRKAAVLQTLQVFAKALRPH